MRSPCRGVDLPLLSLPASGEGDRNGAGGGRVLRHLRCAAPPEPIAGNLGHPQHRPYWRPALDCLPSHVRLMATLGHSLRMEPDTWSALWFATQRLSQLQPAAIYPGV